MNEDNVKTTKLTVVDMKLPPLWDWHIEKDNDKVVVKTLKRRTPHKAVWELDEPKQK